MAIGAGGRVGGISLSSGNCLREVAAGRMLLCDMATTDRDIALPLFFFFLPEVGVGGFAARRSSWPSTLSRAMVLGSPTTVDSSGDSLLPSAGVPSEARGRLVPGTAIMGGFSVSSHREEFRYSGLTGAGGP